jgi:hypothetical protein
LQPPLDLSRRFPLSLLESLSQRLLVCRRQFGPPLNQNGITYFSNHQHQMEYAHYRAKYFPIGSGVTEAACKTLVKQRLCCSGMRCKEKGASIVLSLRALVLTHTRWNQFWGKIDQYGFPIAA